MKLPQMHASPTLGQLPALCLGASLFFLPLFRIVRRLKGFIAGDVEAYRTVD
jgi:hypothetical protein